MRNIESGYFDKLLLTPIKRSALLTGTILSGAVILGLQAALVLGVAMLMGLQIETGFLGAFAVIGMSVLLGLGFAGFTMSAALGSGNAAVTQSASFIFFPLTFLAPTLCPWNSCPAGCAWRRVEPHHLCAAGDARDYQ